MRRYIQYEPFNIYCFEAEKWQHPIHNHTYSEIIFIRKGNGRHIINSNSFEYTMGDVFLLGPEDYHFFEINTLTEFFYIRFTEDFIKTESPNNQKSWHKTIEFLLKSSYQSSGSIVKNEEDKNVLNHLLIVLQHEYEHKQKVSYEVMMDSLMKVILSVLARNIIDNSSIKNRHSTSKPIEELLIYIRKNIHSPKDLRIEQLAEIFNYSQNYLSIFFKKQTGQSLQQYILKYKLKLIEDRLSFSNLNLSQIADEFGFTDISHLHKVFRKYYGVAPKDFRKNLKSRDKIEKE
jgi:AraC family transcriptional regulator, L-rhamnose operon regulatory protein RhaS